MRAEILTIGDELCRGEIVDGNSASLAARLWDLDITTRWMTSCNDDEADLATAVTLAVSRADLVVCSGGLGPTEDDLTVDVVSRLAGGPPVIDEPARARMEAWFARAGTRVTDLQLRQVRIPTGARVHPNPAGLAPGFEVPIGGVPVICMPGFPRELASILDAGLTARLAELRESRGNVERVARRIYRVFGRGESQIAASCAGLVDGVPGASIHYQVKFPEILVKLVVRDHDRAAADARLAAMDASIKERLGALIYGVGESETLVEAVTRKLITSGRSIATAESCTGGMIGELLTRLPGSSKAFRGGAIVYSNQEKMRQLGVREATLRDHGAVSEETVIEMAKGAAERFGVDYAIAISGIAGPDGGTPEKPVGTVWLALASAGDGDVMTTKKLSWPGARDQVRLLAAWWALKLVDEVLS